MATLARCTLHRTAKDVVTAMTGFATPSDTMPAFELTLTPAQMRRVRAMLVEAMDITAWHIRTTSRAHVGVHDMLANTQSDLHDVYQQMVSARASALAGV